MRYIIRGFVFAVLMLKTPIGLTADYNVRWLTICAGCASNPFGITETGIISGNVATTNGERGFLLGRNSNITYIDTPGKIFIELLKGNDHGDFIGVYLEPTDFTVHGFVRSPDASLREITNPGAAVTVTGDISNSGDVVGSYTADPTTATGWVSFIERQGSFPLIFQYPGPNVSGTIALGLNARGAIVGVFTLAPSPSLHAFERLPDGTFIEIAFPGAVEVYISDINASGTAVGFWRDTSGVYHSLIYDDGRCYTVDPGTSPNGYKNSTLTGINNQRQAVGVSFALQPGDGDGFLLSGLPVNGSKAAASISCAVPYQQH